MFTGIIEETGTIKAIKKGPKSIALTVHASKVLNDTALGDSIATNGVCLTVTELTNDTFTVDVMFETLNRSTMHQLKIGSNVNLERALTLNTRLGGHMVSGHIDGVGTVKSIVKEDIAHIYTIETKESLTNYMIEKGSIALDGISLTLIEVSKNAFKVSIIPHTMQGTTWNQIKPGDLVNIEVDLIGKYVEKFVRNKESKSLTYETLKQYGY
ncbi:MAG: riboflavin synthase [Candidatus Izemoplasmataceae bacterium]